MTNEKLFFSSPLGSSTSSSRCELLKCCVPKTKLLISLFVVHLSFIAHKSLILDLLWITYKFSQASLVIDWHYNETCSQHKTTINICWLFHRHLQWNKDRFCGITCCFNYITIINLHILMLNLFMLSSLCSYCLLWFLFNLRV